MTEQMKPAKLSEYPVTVSLPVQWGDQDAFAHVNNAVPIRWLETARIAYFDQAGMGDLLSQQSVGIILASITCNYRRQLNFPDTVTIGARIVRIGNTSLTMEHAIYSQQLADIAADGTSVVVVFDYRDNRPTPVPDQVRQAIAKAEGKPL